MSLVRRLLSSCLIVSFALAGGLAVLGCESDDTSPLTPAAVDASSDHTTVTSDAGGDASSSGGGEAAAGDAKTGG